MEKFFPTENSTDSNSAQNEAQRKGATPKVNVAKPNLTIEQIQRNIRNETPTTSIGTTTRTYNFRLSRSKFSNLIDQSDIKWWVDLQSGRLEAGKDDLLKSTSAELHDIEIQQKTLKRSSYAPIYCPVTDCKMYFLPNDMMLHFLSSHKQSTTIGRMFEKQRLMLTLKPLELNVDEVSCLGLVSYAGKILPSDAVNKSKLWATQNLKLADRFSALKNDYPIFILASIAPLDVLIRSTAKCDGKNICPSMFVFWLAAAQSNANISCTITALNEQLTNSHSGIYDVRPLTESQCPYEFCRKDCKYFHLTFKQLYSMLQDENTLKMELVLHEYFENIE